MFLTWTTESRQCFASFGIPMHVNVLCIRTFSRSVHFTYSYYGYVSFSRRVENIKVKKIIKVSYLNYRESSVFRVFRDSYACERFTYQNVFQIRTFHIFVLCVRVFLSSCWKYITQEGNKCFVLKLPRVVNVLHVSGFLCMWTFYVSERFPDPYISHIRIMCMCLSLLVLKT